MTFHYDKYSLKYSVSGDNLVLGTDESGVDSNANEAKNCSSELFLPTKVDEITVVRIGSSAFRFHGRLRKVVVPRTIKSMGWDAFAYNYDLKDFSFQEGSELTTFDHGIFFRCSSIRFLRLPFNLNSLGNYVFSFTKIKELVYCGTNEIKSDLIFSVSESNDKYIPSRILVSSEYEFDHFGEATEVSKVLNCAIENKKLCKTIKQRMKCFSTFNLFLIVAITRYL